MHRPPFRALEVLRETVESFGVGPAPTDDDVLKLASRSTSVNVATDGRDTVPLLVRKSTHRNVKSTGRVASLLDDEPTRFSLFRSYCVP